MAGERRNKLLYSQFERRVRRAVLKANTLEDVSITINNLMKELSREIDFCPLPKPQELEERLHWEFELLLQLFAERETRAGRNGYRYHFIRLHFH